jgi:hypothetical protein
MLVGCAPAPETPTAPAELAEPTPDASQAMPDPSPAAPAAPVAPDVLKSRLESAIEHVRSRELQMTNAFWTIFHGMLGLGPNVEIVDPASGSRVNALRYVFGGDFKFGAIRGANFVPTAEGLDVTIGPVHVGQGHQDQFIAEIAQWGVPADTPVVVYGKPYTMMDFVRTSMARARVGQELSWTIVVVAHYVGTDAAWTNRMGEKVTFEDILLSEVDAPLDNAACGGTHRLFGITWCYFIHLRAGKDVGVGVWKKAKDKLDEAVEVAKKFQNPDGSFSANYFRGAGTTSDVEDRIGSSGHIFEWLATYLPDETLREPWMQDAALAVSMMILESKARPIESGALYHATHGLVTYHHRLFNSRPPADSPALPESPLSDLPGSAPSP